jgi:hypothetical protein
MSHLRAGRPVVPSAPMRILLVTGFLIGFGLGCDDHGDKPAECEAIIEACHAVDTGPGEIHDCHENAESEWNKDQCVSNSARCLGLCKAGDGGARD